MGLTSEFESCSVYLMTNTNEGLVPTTEEVLSAVQYAGYVAVTENGYEADQAYLDRLAVLFNIWLDGVKQEAYEAGQRDAAENKDTDL